VEGRRVIPLPRHVSAQPPPNRTGSFHCIRLSRIAIARITSPTRSITSVRYPCRTAMPAALRPVRGFPTLPGWSLRHRLLWPLCPACSRYCPNQPPPKRKGRRFPGSCLVTGMGSGWLPNTFPTTWGLRAGSFALPGAWTYLTFAQGLPTTFAAGLQPSWHHRSRMPAAAWSCLAFANNRLTLPIHPERSPFGGRSPPHDSLMSPGS
jgi:hypothetical protein